MKTQLSLASGDQTTPVTVEELSPGRYHVLVGDEAVELDVMKLGAGEYHVLCGDQAQEVLVQPGGPRRPVMVHGEAGSVEVRLLDEQQAARELLGTASALGSRGRQNGAVAICAPMPGKVVKTLVDAGEKVSAGQGVIVIEAMKMENELRAPLAGAVKELRVGEGDSVEAGDALVLVEAGP